MYVSYIFRKAYGQSGEGIEPTPIEIVSDKDSALYENKRD